MTKPMTMFLLSFLGGALSLQSLVIAHALKTINHDLAGPPSYESTLDAAKTYSCCQLLSARYSEEVSFPDEEDYKAEVTRECWNINFSPRQTGSDIWKSIFSC